MGLQKRGGPFWAVGLSYGTSRGIVIKEYVTMELSKAVNTAITIEEWKRGGNEARFAVYSNGQTSSQHSRKIK